MDKGKKALVAVLVDMAMLALLVYAVYRLLKTEAGAMKNIFTAIIVFAIPAMFYATYMAFAGDKFEYNEHEFDDDTDEEDDISGNIAQDTKNS